MSLSTRPLTGPTPPLYVVALYPPDGIDAPVTFLNWRQDPGPRVAAYVTGEIDQAVEWAARALHGLHRPGAVCVYQIADNTAGVMGALAEVVKMSWTVTA
jgi:hypothetical protein